MNLVEELGWGRRLRRRRGGAEKFRGGGGVEHSAPIEWRLNLESEGGNHGCDIAWWREFFWRRNADGFFGDRVAFEVAGF